MIQYLQNVLAIRGKGGEINIRGKMEIYWSITDYLGVHPCIDMSVRYLGPVTMYEVLEGRQVG